MNILHTAGLCVFSQECISHMRSLFMPYLVKSNTTIAAILHVGNRTWNKLSHAQYECIRHSRLILRLWEGLGMRLLSLTHICSRLLSCGRISRAQQCPCMQKESEYTHTTVTTVLRGVCLVHTIKMSCEVIRHNGPGHLLHKLSSRHVSRALLAKHLCDIDG